MVPEEGFLDGLGVIGPSIVCSQALSPASDSGVSEKWEKIEESESIDTRRRERPSCGYGGAGGVDICGLDGGSWGEEDALGEHS